MAEDQDKQKPKTTLIKHRKDEHDSHADEDRKKVRVVVRRKATKAKPKKATEKPTAQSPSTSDYKPSVVRKADEVPPSVREQAKTRRQQPADESVTESATAAPKAELPSPQAEKPEEQAAPKEKAAPKQDAAPAKKEPGPEKRNRFTVSNFQEPPPSVRESVRTGRGTDQPGARSPRSEGRTGGPGGG
ncbi:MAG: hypothetical protein ACOC1I_06865, partial [Spirochaetota bacterium]